MADSTARIVLTAEDKTAAALASLRAGLSGVEVKAISLKGAFSGLLPAVTLTGGAAFVKSINDGVDALNDFKDATGASIENASALEDVAARTGTAFSTVTNAAVRFNQVLADASTNEQVASVFRDLGLSVEELKRIDPAEALRRTAVALAGFADDGDKARRTQELFGRSLKEVAPFLNDLATQTELVGTVTAEQAEQAEKFNKELFALQKNTIDAARSFTVELIPALNGLSKELATGTESAGGFFNAIFTIGTINPFRDQAANIRAYTKELQDLEQTRNDYLGRGFSTAAIDADIADVRAKLAYLKQLQRDAALAGGEGNQSAAESQRLGLVGIDVRPSIGGVEAEDKSARRLLAENEKARATDLAGWVRYAEDKVQADLQATEEIAKNQFKLNDELDRARQTELRQYFEFIDAEQEAAIEAGRQLINSAEEDARRLREVSRDLGLTFSSAFEDAVIRGDSFRNVLKGIADDITRIILRKQVTEPLAAAVSVGIGALFGFEDGGVMTKNGPLPLRAYSLGGIADRPQLALFGEGSMNEAFVPLPDGRSIPVSFKGGSVAGGSVGNVIVQVIEAPGRGGETSDSMVGDDRLIQIFVDQVDRLAAARVMSGNGHLPNALERTYGLNRSSGTY